MNFLLVLARYSSSLLGIGCLDVVYSFHYIFEFWLVLGPCRFVPQADYLQLITFLLFAFFLDVRESTYRSYCSWSDSAILIFFNKIYCFMALLCMMESFSFSFFFCSLRRRLRTWLICCYMPESESACMLMKIYKMMSKAVFPTGT